jgi:hypothetical protein
MALYLAAGLNQSLSMVALSIILLRTSDERFRGRVMGVRMLAIYTLPIGLLAAGPLVSMVGFRGLVVLYVGLGLACWPASRWRGATTCCRTPRRPTPCVENLSASILKSGSPGAQIIRPVAHTRPPMSGGAQGALRVVRRPAGRAGRGGVRQGHGAAPWVGVSAQLGRSSVTPASRRRQGALQRSAASASSTSSSTLAPRARSAASVCSRGLWLMPPALGTKIIAAGQMRAIICASCPAPEVKRRVQ